MRTVSTILFCLLLHTVNAQRCELLSIKHLGGNGSDVIAPPGVISHKDGSFSLCISTTSDSGSIHAACRAGSLLYRYDAVHDILKSPSCALRGSLFEWPTFLVYAQPNGDTILIGTSLAGGDRQCGIERRDRNGKLLWAKSYGGSGQEWKILATPAGDGGFFLLCESMSADGDVGLHYGTGTTADLWVLRLDAEGNKLWSTVIGGSGEDLGCALEASDDGGVYLFGVTASQDHDATGMKGSSDVYVAKLDKNGRKEWHRCLGGKGIDGCGYDRSMKAERDGSGGFYVSAYTASRDGDIQKRLPDGIDFWLLHIDRQGRLLWENTFGGPGSQLATSLCRGTDGSMWIGGYCTGNTMPGGHIDASYRNTDAWVVHADSQGNFINQLVLGADREEYIQALVPLPDASVLACGRYEQGTPGSGSCGFPETNEGDNDIFLARIGPSSVPGATWTFFPDAGKKEIKLEVENDEGGWYQLLVADASGRKVYYDRIRRKATIRTAKWQNGTYLLRLTDKNGHCSALRAITIPY